MSAGDARSDRDSDGSEAILRTDGLLKEFGNFAAIDDVSIAVEPGEFRSVIGPNGAGKTTLFNLISGALSVTEGTVTFQGEDITNLPPEQRIRRGMARSFQISNIFGGLTVRENVRLAAQALHREEYGLREALFRPTDRYDGINDDTDRILDRIGLAGVAEETAAVLATEPELVLFDEPTAGMGPEETQNTIDLIEEVLVDQTLILVEHDIELVMDLSDRITVLHRGEVLSEGTPEEIAEDEAVRDAYLGGMT
ncbi:ABC transporter ATP-binding protein [Halobacteriales archaeon QS_4_66_20]|nr:MAG: ABC transporter ATP-binding protein [Halobacteriales archaeon QS_4_66_20]